MEKLPMKTPSKSYPEWVRLTLLITFWILSIAAARATSLWDEGHNGGRSLFADHVAFRRGDLVTIVVNQSTTTAKDQKTKTSKTTSESESFQALFQPFMGGERTADELTRRNPHFGWGGSRTFDGGGSVADSETLTSTIQARVTDVLPNKVLRIEATRRVETGQEHSDLVLSGLVRQEDISTANSVLSTQVADLQVRQISNGAISREQRKGWLTRWFETLTPF